MAQARHSGIASRGLLHICLPLEALGDLPRVCPEHSITSRALPFGKDMGTGWDMLALSAGSVIQIWPPHPAAGRTCECSVLAPLLSVVEVF